MMSFSSKKNSSKNQKSPASTPSPGDTFFDSLHNSKFSSQTKTKNKIKKENNFYLALNCVLSPIKESILLGTSEFSEINPNQTREENISRYLHHPITKEINKEGNNLIRIKSIQNYDTMVHHPYITKYNNNMKNILNDMILSLKDTNIINDIPARRTLNYNKTDNNININIDINNNRFNTMHRRNLNKQIYYFSNDINCANDNESGHKKNKSSINNNIYNYNNSNNCIKQSKNGSNFTKNENIKRNKSGQVNSTTITKENLNNKDNTNDVHDIKKQIKYEDKLEDLEEPKEIDLKNYIDEDNKNIFLNDYNSDISSLNSNKKINILNLGNIFEKNEIIDKNINTNSKILKKDEIFIFDSFTRDFQNPEIFTTNNIYNIENIENNISKIRDQKTATVKRLRKKYERTEFKKYIYNTNPKINRYMNENESNFDNNNYQDNKEINNNNIYNIKTKIFYSCKNDNQYRSSISPISKKNINKNLLDNFNDCGDDNDTLSFNKKELKNNINIDDNISKNKDININNTPNAEFLDFISNKSDTFHYNKDAKDYNTFIEKDSSNEVLEDQIYNEKNNNMTYEINNSINSENKNIRKYTSSISQSVNDNNNNTYNINNRNCLYDFVSPNKNPEAIIRRNFSLISSFDNDMNINSFLEDDKCEYHSCKNRKNYYKYDKEFSLISESRISDNNNINLPLTESIIKRNKLYLINNKDKLKDSIMNIVPETVYDLTFYQNLIENSQKIRKINYKNILKNHKKINWEDRLHTLCWMMQICEEFAFKRDTYYYACNYLDNYLTFSSEKIKNKKILELIGITCISISGKIEEVQIPKLKEYKNSIDDTFKIKDIIEMEQKICLTLGWKLINTNINTWLNWYVCQWDLYIDSVDDIKEKLLTYINEEDIIYYKKTVDNSYYNYRKICQLVDLIILDYYSYNYDPRVLMAVCLLVIICINYKFEYNFKKKNFKQKTEFSEYIFNKVYIQFLSQSFDFNFYDKSIQNALEYVYKFKNFNFTYELPLLYQIHQDMLEYGNYEDFISYQTTNDNLEDYMKEIYAKRNIKSSSEKTTSYTDKNKNFSSNKSNLK